MSEDGKTPERTPRPSRSRDSRIDAFLRRAAPVLAVERGLTPACKLKLQALADEMGLPADLQAQAMQALQAGEVSIESDRWEKAFADYVESRLKSHRGEILNLDVERRAVKVAEARFRVSAQRAREIFAEVTKRLGIRRITATEAERHVETNVRDLVADATWIDSAARERLVGIGTEWGIPAQQVLAMVELRLRLNRDRLARDRRRVQMMIAAVSITAIAGLSVVGYNLYQRLESTRNADSADEQPNSKPTTSTAATWWSEETRSALGAALARLPRLEAGPNELGSTDPNIREQALDRLALATVDRHDQPESRSRLEALFRNLCIDEPDEGLFDRVTEDLIAASRSPREGLPSGDDFYRRAVTTIRILAEMAAAPQLKAERRTRLQERLGRLTGTLVIPSAADSARVHIEDFLTDAFRRIVAAAPKDARTSVARFAQLEIVASGDISTERRAAWATELLESLLRSAPDSWNEYRSLIDRCAASSQRDHVPALVNLLESSDENDGLRYLATRLRDSYRVTPVDDSLPEVAAALRRELGIGATGGNSASLVRRNLATAASRAAAFEPSGSTTSEQLEALASLVYHGTLAMELALHPEQIESIRDALAAGPPQVASASPSDEPPVDETADPSSFATREANRVIDRIRELESVSITTATSILRLIGQRLNDGLSLEGHPDAEQRLARFLLKSRREEELRRVLDTMPPLVAWRGLGLALVDELERPGADLKVAEQILLEWGDSELSLDESQAEIPTLQRRFLILIAQPPKPTLPTSTAAEREPIAKQAALPTLLAEAYQRRYSAIRTSTLLDGTVAPVSPRAQPGEAAMSTLEAWLARTDSPTTPATPADESLQRRRAADELLVSDDAERLVAAQSLMIDAVAPWIAQRYPERKTAALRSRDSYHTTVASREDRLLQLLDGERTLLSLWMLAR